MTSIISPNVSLISSKIPVNRNCLRQSSYTSDVSVTRAILRTKGNWILEGWYIWNDRRRIAQRGAAGTVGLTGGIAENLGAGAPDRAASLPVTATGSALRNSDK
jgi:hypothetical protein